MDQTEIHEDVKSDLRVPVSPLEKWILACLLGGVFLFIASPFAFKFTNSAGSKVGLPTLRGESPNCLGWVVHLVIFIIVVRIMLR